MLDEEPKTREEMIRDYEDRVGTVASFLQPVFEGAMETASRISERLPQERMQRKHLASIECMRIVRAVYIDEIRPALERLPPEPGAAMRHRISAWANQRTMAAFLPVVGRLMNLTITVSGPALPS